MGNANELLTAIQKAGSGDTITLSNEVTVNLPDFTDGKTLIIDLAGNTLTIENKNAISVEKGANITFKNGTLVANIEGGDIRNAVIKVNSQSTVTLDHVTFNTNITGLLVRGDAAAMNIVNGSEINAVGYCFGTNAATEDNHNVAINLKNSTFNAIDAESSAGTAMYINVPGKLDIDNCQINGLFQGLIVRGGTAEIKNSTIVNDVSTDAFADFFENIGWGEGNMVNLAALTMGNKILNGDKSYNYPTNVTLVNTTITSAGEHADAYPAVYAWGNSDEGNGVTVSYDNCTINGRVVYGNDKISDTVTNGVAKINDTHYLTLPKAMAAAKNGETVTLLRDTAISSQITVRVDLTLDLGGNTLTNSGTGYAFVAATDKAFTLTNGTLKSDNGNGVAGVKGTTITIDKTATIDTKGIALFGTNKTADEGHATFNVYGTLRSDDIAVGIQGPCNTVNIDGANITSNYFGVYQNGSFGGGKFTIKNSTITDKKNDGIYISNSKINANDPAQGKHTLVIENSSITGPTAIETKYTDVTISGENTEITATASPVDLTLNNNGSVTTGYALAITHNGTETAKDSAAGTITVENGKFSGAMGIQLPSDGETTAAKMTITGGHFTSNPSAYVAEGYAALPGTETGYAFTVDTKPEDIVENVEPATGDPVVDMSAIPEESRDAAETVAKSVEDKGELAAAANSVLNTVTEEDKAAAKQALIDSKDVTVGDDDQVYTYVQTYLDIKPTAYGADKQTFTLDITPMYRVVVKQM